MHPHRHVPRAAVHHELHVHAVGVDAVRAGQRCGEQVAGLAEVLDEGDRVRVAHVHVAGRPGPRAHRDLDRVGPGQQGRAHLHGDVAGGAVGGVLRDPGPPHARPGGDGERSGLREAGVHQVAGEDADAVAAHLGDAAVGVAVVHEPLGLVGQVHGGRIGGGAHHPQHPVAADARPPVAERGDGLRADGQQPVVVGEDDEVVLGAVPLEEGETGRLQRGFAHTDDGTESGRGPAITGHPRRRTARPDVPGGRTGWTSRRPVSRAGGRPARRPGRRRAARSGCRSRWPASRRAGRSPGAAGRATCSRRAGPPSRPSRPRRR